MAAQAISPTVALMLSQVTRFGVMVRLGSSFIDLTGEERVNPDLLGRGLCRKSGREARSLDSGRFLFCSSKGFELYLSSNAESLEKLIRLISRQACRKLCSSSPMLLADSVSCVATFNPDSVDGQS